MTVREWLALGLPDKNGVKDYVWIVNKMPDVTGEDDPYMDLYSGPGENIPDDALFLDDEILHWSIVDYYRGADGNYYNGPALALVV